MRSRPVKIFITLGFCIAFAAIAFLFFKNRTTEFPLIYNPAEFVSDDEINQIEQLVRGRGEKFVISINIVSSNKAGATTGQGSHRPQSGRTYDFSRTNGEWKIDGVEEWQK